MTDVQLPEELWRPLTYENPAQPARPVLSVVSARTNAELIEEVAKLWIKGADRVFDATYGRGKWWTNFRPSFLYTNDIDPESPSIYHHDFRDLPEWWNNLFDVVAFDPPYIAQGGRKTSTEQEFLNRYGLQAVPKTPAALRYFIESGIASCARVLKRRGRLLVKTMDYISSGKYHSGYRSVCEDADKWGLTHVDTFIHASGTGPQPKHRRQVHSRRAHSYLLVFEKQR